MGLTRRVSEWRLTELAAVETGDFLVVVHDPATVAATMKVQVGALRGGANKPDLTGNSYTILDSDHVVLIDDDDADVTGTVVVALPAVADSENRLIRIKKIGNSYTVQLDGNGAETIDGAATQDLLVQYDSATIISDGSEWHIL